MGSNLDVEIPELNSAENKLKRNILSEHVCLLTWNSYYYWKNRVIKKLIHNIRHVFSTNHNNEPY